MAQNSTEVMTTEETITEAARAGDLKQLGQFARQGIRATTVAPQYKAVEGGSLKVLRFLVEELGADVNQGNCFEVTTLMKAARWASVAGLARREHGIR
jgi:hypothetical protein